MVENNSVLRAQRKNLFLAMSVSYDSYFSYLLKRNGIIWCALRIFAQRNNLMSVEGKSGTVRRAVTIA